MNKMRDIKVEKITLNIGAGEAGDKLTKASKLLKTLTGATPIKTRTMKRVPTWGIRPKLDIATKVTLRGDKSEEVLRRLFSTVDNKIPENKFDKFGNFSFGINEYIDIPGVEYDANIGIIGLEAAVTLKRAGFRIKRRRINRTKIPARHRISREESMDFIKNKFNVMVTKRGE